jgi:hypothetical protein
MCLALLNLRHGSLVSEVERAVDLHAVSKASTQVESGIGEHFEDQHPNNSSSISSDTAPQDEILSPAILNARNSLCDLPVPALKAISELGMEFCDDINTEELIQDTKALFNGDILINQHKLPECPRHDDDDPASLLAASQATCGSLPADEVDVVRSILYKENGNHDECKEFMTIDSCSPTVFATRPDDFVPLGGSPKTPEWVEHPEWGDKVSDDEDVPNKLGTKETRHKKQNNKKKKKSGISRSKRKRDALYEEKKCEKSNLVVMEDIGVLGTTDEDELKAVIKKPTSQSKTRLQEESFPLTNNNEVLASTLCHPINPAVCEASNDRFCGLKTPTKSRKKVSESDLDYELRLTEEHEAAQKEQRISSFLHRQKKYHLLDYVHLCQSLQPRRRVFPR